MKFPRLVVSPVLSLLAMASVATLKAQVRFYGIGDLAGGITYSEVRDATKVNGVIYAVGNSAANAGSTAGDTAILWTSNGGLRALPNLVTNTTGTSFITASAITPGATFIASRARSVAQGNARNAVRVSVNGLTNLNLGFVGTFGFSAANAISSDGSVLYGFSTYLASGQTRAVRFQASDQSILQIPFAFPGHDTSSPAFRGTSADGNVMVGSSSNSSTSPSGFGEGSRAFRYVHSSAAATGIPLLPGGTWNSAVALNPNGALTLVAGDGANSPFGEFYLHNAANNALTPLGSPNGQWGPNNVAGINSDGSLVVANFNESNTSGAGFLRNRNGWHDFQTLVAKAGVNLTGWQLRTPSGISPDGTLVFGTGIHNGNSEGWVMEFPAGYLAAYTEPASFSNPGRAIVGAWTFGNPSTDGSGVIVFFPNGYYIQIQDANAAEVADKGTDGFERGQYTWDAATGAFWSASLLDTNGSVGLSPGGGGGTITISGDVLTARGKDGSFTLNRVTGTSPIVGAYGWANQHDNSVAVVFLPGGQFFTATDGNPDPATGGDPSGKDGMERGTYTWNPTTGALTVNVAVDTNGEWGLSHSFQPIFFIPSSDGVIVRENGQQTFSAPRVKAASTEVPTITTQPASVTVAAQLKAGFTVAANGTAPFSYQWRKDGVNIAGATTASYGIAAVTAADAGDYSCVVSNSLGSVTSAVATLTVTRNYAGTYFGDFAGGRGSWALNVLRDGTGTYVAFLNNPRAGIVVPIRVDSTGAFRADTTLLQAGQSTGIIEGRQISAAGTPATVTGTIGTSTVTGTVQGPNIAFSGTPDPATGETAAVAGLYQGAGSGGTTTYTVVGTNRTVLALTVGATNVNGGLGSIGSNGTFAVTTSDNTTITGSVTTAGTITSTVTAGGSAAVTTTGKSVETVGAPVIANPPLAQSAVAGAPITLTVEARGAPLTYQWRKNGANIAGATAATYAISAAQTADAADYTCVVTNSGGSVTTAPAALAVAPYNAGRLVNLSILTDISSPGDNFRLGTVVGGAGTSGTKALLVRAAGPSLTALGVGGALADPTLESFFGTTKTGENDNWGGGSDLSATFARLGAFPYASAGSRDAAIFNPATPSGNNTLLVSGVGNATGTVIAELYEATPAPEFALTTPRLVNVSVLKDIGSGFTLGFVVSGNSSATVLIRAVGPGLAAVGVTSGTVRDPSLKLFAGETQIDDNDNWGGTAALTAAMGRVGAFAIPATSLDAAVLATLPPGSYTVRVSGGSETSGLVIAEVYEVR